MTAARHGASARLLAWARLLLALGLLLAVPVAGRSQGCSMCRETAAFQKDRAVTALKGGIVALAIPPAAIVAGVAWLTWKRGNRFASG